MSAPTERDQGGAGTGPAPEGFRWWWLIALHGPAFVVMPLLGYGNADPEPFYLAAALFGVGTLVQTVLAAEGGRYWRALFVLVLGAVLQVAAFAAGVLVAFMYHFTLF